VIQALKQLLLETDKRENQGMPKVKFTEAEHTRLQRQAL
jgi:hypothetical protein